MAEWIKVGTLADIPRQGARTVGTALGPVAIFRTADDTVFAVVDRCPHRQGPLSAGIVHGHRVTCPLHGWDIDLASGTAIAPDVGCAPTVPVRLDDGAVWLQVATGRNAVDA
jgi:nitrite reductase (NADH) small subunit